MATFADIYNKYFDRRVRREPTHAGLPWHIERCPVCWQRKTANPACHLAVGIIQEALSWINSGISFQVEEIRCVAQGEVSCTLRLTGPALEGRA